MCCVVVKVSINLSFQINVNLIKMQKKSLIWFSSNPYFIQLIGCYYEPDLVTIGQADLVSIKTARSTRAAGGEEAGRGPARCLLRPSDSSGVKLKTSQGFDRP